MNLTWANVIAALSAGRRLIVIANTPPSAAEYISGRYLPRVQMPDFDVEAGQIEIVATMAGHVGMDSKLPKGSALRLSNFKGKTAKFGQALELGEEESKQLHKLLLLAQANQAAGRSVEDFMAEAGLNLYNKGVVQSVDDTAEYLALQALTRGKIDWTFNGRRLFVDYKVPEANRVSLTGAQRLSGPESGFWRVISQGEKTIKGSVGIVMSQNTLQDVLDNPVHRIEILSDTYSPQRNVRVVQVRKMARMVANADGTVGYTAETTSDQATSATLIGFGREGQIVDPTEPGETIGVPMVLDNVIALIGRNDTRQLVSLTGTPIPENALGYVHVAPTVEGMWRGEPLGRWGRLYTPDEDPYLLVAELIENSLPIIRNAGRLFLIESDPRA